MLESGKAFREKKALPILGKLLKYARSLFRENTELKAKVQKLEKENPSPPTTRRERISFYSITA